MERPVFLKTSFFMALLALLVSVGTAARVLWKGSGGGAKIAFVDSKRVMVGFKQAHLVNKEIESADEKWRKDLKAAEDSLKVFLDSMTRSYDRSDIKTRKQLQDDLSVRNQQIANFEKANIRKMEELTQSKMAKIYEKLNSYLKEYGKANGYDIIFATAHGSIVYGEGTRVDITDAVIEGLNKRYE